jgi:hypothetical protein
LQVLKTDRRVGPVKEVGMYLNADLVRLRMEELRREADRDRLVAEARVSRGPGHVRALAAGALGRISSAAAAAEIHLLNGGAR